LIPLAALGLAPVLAWALSSLSRTPPPSLLPRGLQLVSAGALCCLIIGGLAKKVERNLHDAIHYSLGLLSYRDYLAGAPMGEELNFADGLDLSRYVAETVPEDGHFLFWGRPIAVNYLAARRSPSHIASFAMFDEPTAAFSRFAAWQARFRDDLTRKPPQLVCLVRGEAPGSYAYLPEPVADKPRLGDVLHASLQQSYQRDRSFGPVDCFRRDPAGRSARNVVVPTAMPARTAP
jgi:hypothetical protein